MDPECFDYRGLVLVLMVAAFGSVGSLWLLKKLGIRNVILLCTLGMGMGVVLVGLLKGLTSIADAAESALFGMMLGLPIGLLLWGIQRLRSKRPT